MFLEIESNKLITNNYNEHNILIISSVGKTIIWLTEELSVYRDYYYYICDWYFNKCTKYIIGWIYKLINMHFNCKF